MLEIFQMKFFHNTVMQYIWFIGSFLLCVIVIQFFKTYIFKKIYKWTAKKSQTAEETILPAAKRNAPSILLCIAFYFSIPFFISIIRLDYGEKQRSQRFSPVIFKICK